MMDIDREIAEKVMGWTFNEHIGWTTPVSTTCRKITGYAAIFNDMTLKAWCPSTDIAQALQVVEKMREQNWCFDLAVGHNKWRAFLWGEDKIHYGEAWADTPEMAICIAVWLLHLYYYKKVNIQ